MITYSSKYALLLISSSTNAVSSFSRGIKVLLSLLKFSFRHFFQANEKEYCKLRELCARLVNLREYSVYVYVYV